MKKRVVLLRSNPVRIYSRLYKYISLDGNYYQGFILNLITLKKAYKKINMNEKARF